MATAGGWDAHSQSAAKRSRTDRGPATNRKIKFLNPWAHHPMWPYSSSLSPSDPADARPGSSRPACPRVSGSQAIRGAYRSLRKCVGGGCIRKHAEGISWNSIFGRFIFFCRSDPADASVTRVPECWKNKRMTLSCGVNN